MPRDSAFFEETAKISKNFFGQARSSDHLRKAVKEIDEVIAAPHEHKLIEYADVLICMQAAIGKDGFTWDEVLAAIEYKQAVLKRREWTQTADGTYQHVSLIKNNADV